MWPIALLSGAAGLKERPENRRLIIFEKPLLCIWNLRRHHKRAALIRKLRRMPRKLDIGYIRPAVVHAIINGTTPILQALDEKPHRETAAAA